MRDIIWYFPKTLKEASELLKKDNTIPHGGGTSILRGGLNRVKGLIDLSHLPLKFIRIKNRDIHIGAFKTYAEVSENMYKIDEEHILVKALSV